MKQRMNNLKRPFILRIEDDNTGLISYNGSLIKLNETTIEILILLNEGKKFNEIVFELKDIYEVTEEQLKYDINEVIEDLDKYGIIDKINI